MPRNLPCKTTRHPSPGRVSPSCPVPIAGRTEGPRYRGCDTQCHFRSAGFPDRKGYLMTCPSPAGIHSLFADKMLVLIKTDNRCFFRLYPDGKTIIVAGTALRQPASCNVRRLSDVTRTLFPIPVGVAVPAAMDPLKAQERLS